MQPADLLLPTRRLFLQAGSAAVAVALVDSSPASPGLQAETGRPRRPVSDADRERMRALATWTGLSLDTPQPVPYGAEIVDTRSGVLLMRGLNAVGPENDPSAHAELRTIRLACAKLESSSLRGYTLYTTCEPCAMCMACALWAGLDRVVYGATIADASKTGHQIQIPAAFVASKFDLPCVVDGPVERERCYALFTDPRMQKTFARWRTMK